MHQKTIPQTTKHQSYKGMSLTDENTKSCERHLVANKESASEIRNRHLVKAYNNPKSPVKDINEKHSIFK